MIIQDTVNLFQEVAAPATSQTAYNAQGDVGVVTIEGTFVGSIAIEGRAGAGAWQPLAGVNMSNFKVVKAEYTDAGMYELDVVGVREMRARVTSITSGSVSVNVQLISTSEV